MMPWEYHLSDALRDGSIFLMLIAGVIFAIRMGRRRKLPTDLGRKVEDFAGATGEANGPIPTFLLYVYIAVAAFWILYTINVIINGYRY